MMLLASNSNDKLTPMPFRPDFATFQALAKQYDLVPVYRRLLCDSLTPVSAFHRIDNGGTACLFESVIGGEKVGRYSFLAADPFLEVSARGQTVTVTTTDGSEQLEVNDPLQEISAPIGRGPRCTRARIGPATVHRRGRWLRRL